VGNFVHAFDNRRGHVELICPVQPPGKQSTVGLNFALPKTEVIQKEGFLNFPLQVQFRNMDESDFVYNAVWDHAERLEIFFNRITSCQVIVSLPHRHKHRGNIYTVQLRLHVPGGDVYISTTGEKNHAHEDVYVAVRDAFDAAKRKLEDVIRQRRGFVKRIHAEAHGRVTRIFPNDGYGFIETPDHRDIYFHRNSVLNTGFDNLDVGDEVRFNEEAGENGPQVTSMEKVGRSGHLRVRT
jgi:cold shock CspA family protein/ribosome-associated translation inhibitor RaiA